MPLRVVLTSPGQRRHVRVGEDVTLIALAQGRCASLTLSYRRGLRGAATHSFTEGGLLSTTWTPSLPGRYEFTATALGGPRQTAVSRPVEIIVDAPIPQMMARGEAARSFPAETITPLPPMAVRLPPPQPARRSASVPPLPRLRRVKPRTEAPPPVPETMIAGVVTPSVVIPSAAPPDTRPAPAVLYHVAAAQFPLSRSAVVLAKSFRLQGSPATTKRMIGYHGRTVYAVVTGAYRRPEEARAAVLVLQRSGYPAYLYGGN